MSDSDDSDCAPIVKVSSVILPTTWEVVPDNVDFIFKVKMNGVLGKWSKLGYTLKKGVSTILPSYWRFAFVIFRFLLKLIFKSLIGQLLWFLGMKFIFTRLLEPEITGKVGKKEKGCWKFYGNSLGSQKTQNRLLWGNHPNLPSLTGFELWWLPLFIWWNLS